jgi:hypothetical protein
MLAAKDGVVSGIDLRVAPSATIDQLNGLVGKKSADAGVVAIEVRSRSATCTPDGGKLSLVPSEFGAVMYAQPTAGGMADAALASVQPGAAVAAWIPGVVPPAAYARMTFEKAGCKQVAPPVQEGSLSFMGMLHIEPGSLSQAIVFVE